MDHVTATLDPARADRRTDRLVAGLTVATVTALLAVGAATGRPNWPVYLVVLTLGGAGVVWLHLRTGFTLATRIGLALFGIGHVAGGMLPVGDGVLYQQWLIEPAVRYDNLQHAVGFGFVGRAVLEVLAPRLGTALRDRTLVVWIVVLAAVAAGAVNEIVEWVMVLTIPGTDVGGYDNTARDLVANLVGGLVVGLWTARRAD